MRTLPRKLEGCPLMGQSYAHLHISNPSFRGVLILDPKKREGDGDGGY